MGTEIGYLTQGISSAPAMVTPETIIALWVFGVLCAVAGIGGGGILLWILTFMGSLPLQDAMPLSRVVVLIGSLVSLALNVGRHLPDCSEPLINWLLVKMVVPMALLGTLIGATTHEQAPGSEVLVVLVSMMGCTLILVLHRAQQQHLEELNADQAPQHMEEVEGLLDNKSFEKPTPLLPGWGSSIDFEVASLPRPKTCCSRFDVLLLVSVTILVFSCGALQSHVRACFQEQQQARRGAIHHRIDHVRKYRAVVEDVDSEFVMSKGILRSVHTGPSCRHPVLSVAFWGHAEVWFWRKGLTSKALLLFLALPVCACFGTAMFYVYQALSENCNRRSIACYLSVGLVAGVLTSIAGICGGLVFSPFFLLVGVEPTVAIATSSTCVVFISGSMAIQYFLIDRVQLQLAVAYGSVNAIASLCGTSLMQHLGQNCLKKSHMMLIVAFGLAMSFALWAVNFKGTELIQLSVD